MARSALFIALLCVLLLGSIVQGRAAASGISEDPVDLTPKGRSTSGPDPELAAAAAAAGTDVAAAAVADSPAPEAGVAPVSSQSTRDIVISALQLLGADNGTTIMIAAALPNDAATFRDLLIPTRVDDGPLRTPAQAAVAFNGVLNDAFFNATQELMDTIMPNAVVRHARGRNPPRSTGAGADGIPSVDGFPGFPGVVVGLGGVPMDAGALAGAFVAGTGLPPVGLATPADFDAFTAQFLGDLGKQQQRAISEAAKFQQQARSKDQALKNACVQYALAEFLSGLAAVTAGISTPYGAVFGLLSQLVGLGYTGLSQDGNTYLNAYCCGLARETGIDIQVGNGTVEVGPVGIDLNALLGAIPGVGADAANIATTATDAIGTVLGAVQVGDARSGDTKRPPPPPQQQQQQGLSSCGMLDWLAFALQGNRRLQNQFNRLINGVIKLRVRLITQSLNNADQASNRAAKLLKRLQDQAQQGRGRGRGRGLSTGAGAGLGWDAAGYVNVGQQNAAGITGADAADAALGQLIDQLGVLMGRP